MLLLPTNYQMTLLDIHGLMSAIALSKQQQFAPDNSATLQYYKCCLFTDDQYVLAILREDVILSGGTSGGIGDSTTNSRI